MEIRTREQWGAVHDYSTPREVEVPASQLFLHVTVTRPESYSSNDAHARKVEEIGINRFGIGISYNALIMPGGLLYEGQPIRRRGAHTVNDYKRATCPVHGGSLRSKAGLFNLNYSARAIALARMDTDPVTDADVEAAAQWGAELIRKGEVERGALWHCHHDVTNKGCPGPGGHARIPEIQARMESILEDELAVLTESEQLKLQAFLGNLDAIGSSVSFVLYLIPWFRKLSNLTPAQLAELEESAEIDALEAKVDQLIASGSGIPFNVPVKIVKA